MDAQERKKLVGEGGWVFVNEYWEGDARGLSVHWYVYRKDVYGLISYLLEDIKGQQFEISSGFAELMVKEVIKEMKM